MLVQSKHLAPLLFFFSLTDIVFVLGTCSPACLSCTNDTCVACDVGSYLASGLCYTCPENCSSCNNSVVCYNCTDGYYGLSCEKNCSSMCLNNTCNKDGACLHGCIEGYYLYGSSCYPCNAVCKTCANFSNTCLECKEGYYGSSCQYHCSRCKDGICSRDNCTNGCSDGLYKAADACNSCSENCRSCSISSDNCHACVDGYFGPKCQFECSDCSPCNQDGSCPSTITGPTPTITTQPISTTKELVTTSFPITTISTRKSRPPTSTAQRTGTSKQSVTTSFPTTTISTTTPSQSSTSQDSTATSDVFPTNSLQPLTNIESNSKDNTLIIYATTGAGGGLVVIILVIVVVCKRRVQSDNVAESIDMTENENYISADDINNLTRNSSNARKEVKQNEQESNDDLYSQPNKMHRPTMVSIQTISTETIEGSSSNISPRIPAKNNVYSDLI